MNATPVITGRATGIYRLSALIVALKLEMQGLKGHVNAYMTLKRELKIKGNREKVLTISEAVKANVANW